MYVAIRAEMDPNASAFDRFETFYEVGFYDPQGTFKKLGDRYGLFPAMEMVAKLNGHRPAAAPGQELSAIQVPAGISTRDFLAGQAMNSIISVSQSVHGYISGDIVRAAYSWADAMLKLSTDVPGSMYDELLAIFAPYAEAAPAPLSALKAVVVHVENLLERAQKQVMVEATEITTDDPTALDDCLRDAKETLQKITVLFVKLGKLDFNA